MPPWSPSWSRSCSQTMPHSSPAAATSSTAATRHSDYAGRTLHAWPALRPDTDLVTITIGGNDINIGDLWLACAQLGPTDPTGDPCQRQVTAGGTDLYAQRIAL